MGRLAKNETMSEAGLLGLDMNLPSDHAELLSAQTPMDASFCDLHDALGYSAPDFFANAVAVQITDPLGAININQDKIPWQCSRMLQHVFNHIDEGKSIA